MTPLNPSLLTGDSLKLTATVRDQHSAEMTGQTVAWSSSNLTLATVAASGWVTALAEGTVTLTASVAGKSGGTSIQIRRPGLAGVPDAPVAGNIARISFVARPEDYTATHPDLPGIFVSFNTILLNFAPGTTTRDANTLLNGIDATVVGGIPGVPGSAPGILIVRVPTQSHAAMIQLLATLRADARIAHAVQDVLLETDQTSRAAPGTALGWDWDATPAGGNWGLELSRVPQMWNLSPAIEKERSRTGVLGPKTFIFDLGFADSHQDLDYENLTPGTLDEHGTHVAGIIGAKYDNGFGIDGVNPFARMVVRAGSFFHTGTTTLALKTSSGQAILSGLDSLLRAHSDIRVLNISLGYNWWSGPVNTSTNAPARQLASDQGALFRDLLLGIAAAGGTLPVVVVSAGNDSNSGMGVQQSKYSSPMAAAALIHDAAPVVVVEAVALSAGSTGGATRVDFSNVNGHLSAPGKGILSTVLSDGYGMKDGTSMAAPHVAGLVGYLYALLPAFPAPTMTENKVRDLLVANGVTVAGGASPRMDAFATLLDADRVLAGNVVLRKLLDIDDGSPDGNRRDLLVEDIDQDGGTGDGRIDMSDFRRWRDWLLQLENSPDLMLDGEVDNAKKDVNGDGNVETPAFEKIYPRGDFNGDGILSRTAVKRVPGVMGNQNVTDLQVLQRLFSDPNYIETELPDLLNSADLTIDASECLALPGVGHVTSSFEATGTSNFLNDRVHNPAAPIEVFTGAVRAAGYNARSIAFAPNGAELGRSEATFPLKLGSDTTWHPTCVPPLALAGGSLGLGAVGAAFVRTLQATGGTGNYQWTIASGQLPPGLSLGGSTGIIAGTPSAAGTFSFTVKVVSGTQSVQRAFTLGIEPPDPWLGRWRGTRTGVAGASGTVAMIFTLVFNPSLQRYDFSISDMGDCFLRPAANNLGFTGACSGGSFDETVVTGTRGGTSMSGNLDRNCTGHFGFCMRYTFQMTKDP